VTVRDVVSQCFAAVTCQAARGRGAPGPGGYVGRVLTRAELAGLQRLGEIEILIQRSTAEWSPVGYGYWRRRPFISCNGVNPE
jgi:hypothetical protein